MHEVTSVQSNWERNCPRAVLHYCMATTLSEGGLEEGSGRKFSTVLSKSVRRRSCKAAQEPGSPSVQPWVLLG